MSKDQDIANIVKQLDTLTIQQTQHILKYIKQAKEDNQNKTKEDEEDTPYL